MLSLTHRETLEKFLPKKFEAERVSLRSNSYSTPHKFRREFEFALRALCPHRSSSTLARLRARREVRRLGKITCPFQGRVFFIFFLFFFRNFSLLLFLFFFTGTAARAFCCRLCRCWQTQIPYEICGFGGTTSLWCLRRSVKHFVRAKRSFAHVLTLHEYAA
jgi:hypothetical protein